MSSNQARDAVLKKVDVALQSFESKLVGIPFLDDLNAQTGLKKSALALIGGFLVFTIAFLLMGASIVW
jgi:hypothetical protein